MIVHDSNGTGFGSVQASWRGLLLDGFGSYDLGGPDDPGSSEMELYSFHLEDPSAFEEWALVEDFSKPVQKMIDIAHRTTGKLLPIMRKRIEKEWHDDMIEAMWEESSR